VEAALLDVEDDGVSVLDGGDWPTDRGLGRHVTHHEAVARAREAAVGHQRNGGAEAGALQRAGDVEHLAQSRPASRAFVPDDDEVARLDLPGLDGQERILLAVEHSGAAAEGVIAVAGELGHATIGREVALEDSQATMASERVGERTDHLLTRRFARGAGGLADRLAADGHLLLVEQPRLEQSLGHDGHAARFVHLGRRIAAPRLHVGQEWRPARDPVELVDVELDTGFLGDGETPSISNAVAIVLAVNCPPQAPSPGQAAHSMAWSSSGPIFPALHAPMASKTSCTVSRRP